MSKQFWIVLAAIVVILGGIVFVTNRNNNTTTNTNAKPTNHVEGSTSTGVTLIEYGDYQCPICGNFYSAVNQVASLYSSKIVFQFRNLPLTSIHQNAFAAARAAEAAGLMGKYWQMHDLLYTNQATWAESSNPQTYFDAYATQLGLSVSTFNQDYASDQANNNINADIAAFNKTGDEMATPTFYLDGKKLDNTKLIDSSGVPSVADFQKLIDAEITAKAQKR